MINAIFEHFCILKIIATVQYLIRNFNKEYYFSEKFK